MSVSCSLFSLVHILGFCLSPSADGAASPGQGRGYHVYPTGTPQEGHTVTLSCHLDPPSLARPSSYVWVKDGKVMPGQTTNTINVGPLTKQDEGNYQCGDPDSGIPRWKHQLNVNVPGTDMVSKPTVFMSGLPVAGRPFYLDCVILEGYTANANTRYTWYKNHTEVKGETGQLLRFSHLTEEDEGEYVCTAREGAAKTTSPRSSAYYLKPLVPPQIQMKPSSNDSVVRGVLGENLTLTCEVTRASPPVPMEGYSWSYLPSKQDQGQPLEKSSTLTLSPLTRNHSGQYQCQARNDHDFPGMDLTGRASVNVDVVYLENISVRNDLEVSEGERLTLTCSVDSHPAALLTWTVNGKVERNETANTDRYIIQSTHCSDSGNYTCSASNIYLPNQELAASTSVQVRCNSGPRYRPVQPGIIHIDVSAPFDFSLPEEAAMVVVHPSGQDIVTFFQNCSSDVTPAFQHRCLHRYCDLADHHVSFTLTQLSERDEGDYVCFEIGDREKPIPNSTRTLVIKKQASDGMQTETKVSLAIAVVFAVLLFVSAFIRHRKMTKAFIRLCRKLNLEKVFSMNSATSPFEPWTYEGSHKFEKLYEKGQVYVFPKLVPPLPPQKAPEAVREERSGELTALMIESDEASQEEAAYTVKDLVRSTLQQSACKNDPPSFLLHNTRLSREENVTLILSRKLGVVVMVVNSVHDEKEEDLESLQKSTKHLLDAKRIVEEKVKGPVLAPSITAVIALPNLSTIDMSYLREKVKILDSNRDVEVVFGREQKDFMQWAERLSSRPDNEVWDCSHQNSADTAFEKTASKFLTLAGSCPPLESSTCPMVAETWLLTPEQMEVRDSTARLLHIWGAPGSGKTMILTHKARQWLADGMAVVIVVGREIYDVMLSHVADAISREQGEETTKKLRVCRTCAAMQDAIKELKAQFPNVDICVVIHTVPDTEFFEAMLQAVESGQASAVWSTCPENLQAFDKRLSEKARKLGWETAKLPLCVRCTKSTVELLNMLAKGSPYHDEITSGSTTPDDKIRKWEVLDHCRHPDHISTMYTCHRCREKMHRILSNQGQHLSWSDWIALYTGDPGVSTDIKHLCTTLRALGLPACLDIYDDIFAGHDNRLNASDITSGTAKNKWWERIVDGVDERGTPAAHLIRVKDFSGGLEIRNIVLVHWDERDEDPTQQSQDKKKQRLEEHSGQWIRGVSRSKGQVILLLLTPSPARSLLDLPEVALPGP